MTVIANRAKMTTSTTGTGTITLGSAVSGFQTFNAAGVTDGSTVSYVIEDGSSWEVGVGTYTHSNTSLTRTVTESSNAGSAINLTGNAVVFVSLTSDDFGTTANKILQLDSSGKVPAVDGSQITGLAWSYSTATSGPVSASDNDYILANTTSGAFTVNLPASPTSGDRVAVQDSAGTWEANNLTVDPGVESILDVTGSLVCDVDRMHIQFVYDGTTWVWSPTYGISIPGNGDMSTTTYDPNSVAADAFARANHTGPEAVNGSALSTASGVLTIDPANGKFQRLAPTENITSIVVSAFANGDEVILNVTAGSYTIDYTGLTVINKAAGSATLDATNPTTLGFYKENNVVYVAHAGVAS